MSQNLKNQQINDVNLDDLVQGITDAMNGGELKFSLEEASQAVQAHFQAQAMKQHEARLAEGAEFLAKNAERAGVTALPSGLQYEVITEGKGAKPTASDMVSTHYHGTLINGEVFDSSVQRGQPAQFPVNGVIAGWTEALMLMGVGSKWRLFVPHNLAYGERGAGQDIAPFSTLIFEVELLEIVAE